MKLAISAFAFALCFSPGLAPATERTVTLAVDNMTCASCPYIVKQTLSGISGVHRVDVSFKTKTAAVVFDDAVASPVVLIDATTKAGYPSKVTQ